MISKEDGAILRWPEVAYRFQNSRDHLQAADIQGAALMGVGVPQPRMSRRFGNAEARGITWMPPMSYTRSPP